MLARTQGTMLLLALPAGELANITERRRLMLAALALALALAVPLLARGRAKPERK